MHSYTRRTSGLALVGLAALLSAGCGSGDPKNPGAAISVGPASSADSSDSLRGGIVNALNVGDKLSVGQRLESKTDCWDEVPMACGSHIKTATRTAKAKNDLGYALVIAPGCQLTLYKKVWIVSLTEEGDLQGSLILAGTKPHISELKVWTAPSPWRDSATCYATVQSDGNFVLRDDKAPEKNDTGDLWASNGYTTNDQDKRAPWLILSSSGEIVVGRGKTISEPGGSKNRETNDNGTPNLDCRDSLEKVIWESNTTAIIPDVKCYLAGGGGTLCGDYWGYPECAGY